MIDLDEGNVKHVEFKGSRTEANLYAAYAGESQAFTKYLIYANQARKDGYVQIADIFDETAHNEQEHAELWLKRIKGGSIPSTADNLKDGSAGEHFEWTQMYKEFAETAREEGFKDIAATFELVAGIEKRHEERYNTLTDNLENDKVFHREENTQWICLNCGYVYEGAQPPQKCPVCLYPQAYFAMHVMDY